MVGKVSCCSTTSKPDVYTLAGPVPGIVEKVELGCDLCYNVVLTNGGCGEGSIGVSCARPITYNPNELICTYTDEETGEVCEVRKGVLRVDCLIDECGGKAKSSSAIEYNSVTNAVEYNIPLWMNGDCIYTEDGKTYNSLAHSDACTITYNPRSGDLKTYQVHLNNATVKSNIQVGLMDCCQVYTRLQHVCSCNAFVIRHLARDGDARSWAGFEVGCEDTTGNVSMCNYLYVDTNGTHTCKPYRSDHGFGLESTGLRCYTSRWIPQLYGLSVKCSDAEGPSTQLYYCCPPMCSYWCQENLKFTETTFPGAITSNTVCTGMLCAKDDCFSLVTYDDDSGYTCLSLGCGYMTLKARNTINFCTEGDIRMSCLTVNSLCVLEGSIRGECGITLGYDIVGHCESISGPTCWYIYCDGSACFGNGDCFEVNELICANCGVQTEDHNWNAAWGNCFKAPNARSIVCKLAQRSAITGTYSGTTLYLRNDQWGN